MTTQMMLSSFTQKRELRRCPKRYFFRYLHEGGIFSTPDHRCRRQLYGLPELGGYVIHRALSAMIEDFAGVAVGWDPISASQRAREDFDSVVETSFLAGPEHFTGDMQLSEAFNGMSHVSLQQELTHWRKLIPRAIANGIIAARKIRIPVANDTVRVEAEKVMSWKVSSLRFRNVLDVLISSPFRAVVVEWKSHSVRDEDIEQVQFYMKLLHEKEDRPLLGLFGHIVDLQNADVIDVTYNPHRFLHNRFESGISALPTKSSKERDLPLESTPEPTRCSRCPYSTICKDSATHLRIARRSTAPAI